MDGERRGPEGCIDRSCRQGIFRRLPVTTRRRARKNDNGAVEIDVLNYWRQTGVGGHKIVAYVALEPSNREHVRDACFIFGGCYIGLALPTSAQTQDVWSVPPVESDGSRRTRIVGGTRRAHRRIRRAGGLVVVSGAPLKRMTWEFWDAYCDEAYAIYSTDFLEPDKKAPNGFDMAALLRDLELVKGEARPLSSVAGASRAGLRRPTRSSRK